VNKNGINKTIHSNTTAKKNQTSMRKVQQWEVVLANLASLQVLLTSVSTPNSKHTTCLSWQRLYREKIQERCNILLCH